MHATLCFTVEAVKAVSLVLKRAGVLSLAISLCSIADGPELSSNPFSRFAGFQGIKPIRVGSRRNMHFAEGSHEKAMVS